MGKLKKNSRSSRHRSNPLAVSRKATSSKQDEQLTKNKILPLIAKLKSTTPNEKSMALGSIAVMSDDPKFRKLLLKERLVQIVLEQCLTDSNSEIVVESFGLLRNLVLEEGYDVAVYLWRQNIWRVIQDNLNKCVKGWHVYKVDATSLDKVAKSLLFDMIENLISLIVGLCDSSDDIFNAVMKEMNSLREFLKDILAVALDLKNKELKITVSLFNAILDLIYDFSTISDEFVQSLTSEWDLNFELLETFVNEVPRFTNLSRVYIQGIRLQLVDISDQSAFVQIVAKILGTLTTIDIGLNRDIMLKEIDNGKLDELKMDAKKRVDARAEFQTVELSLELLTAMIELISYNDSLDAELANALCTQVRDVLIALIPHLEFRSRALTALNNLSWLFVSIQVPQWTSIAQQIWVELSQLDLSQCDVEEKTSIFGCLWAILNVVPLELDSSFVQSLCQELDSNSSSSDNVEYSIRLVGVLSMLAKQQGQVERNLLISQLLFNLLESDKTPSRLTFEILDQLYDIYGDSLYDYNTPVFVSQCYLKRLEQLAPRVKTSFKLIDKNVDKEFKLKAEEIYNNLGRFIDYKKSEV